MFYYLNHKKLKVLKFPEITLIVTTARTLLFAILKPNECKSLKFCDVIITVMLEVTVVIDF